MYRVNDSFLYASYFLKVLPVGNTFSTLLNNFNNFIVQNLAEFVKPFGQTGTFSANFERSSG